VDCPEEFTEFAAADMARLRRTAFLLCGDWHAAEDLTQIALTKTLLAWRRIRRQENAHAYAHKSLVNTYLSHRRTRRSGEVPVDRFPESSSARAPGSTAELRIVLMDALAALPPQARAVVVLRYWEDLSIDQVAAILRCSTGNVKSQSARALEKLRGTLGGSLPELAVTD
jgi:RNA polymerase sigma-70 factor (sigma-E family)